MQFLRNFVRYKSQWKLGDCYRVERVVTQEMVETFVKLIGDENPIHSAPSEDNGKDSRVPGALLNSLVSGLIGTHFPGAGSLVVAQEYTFPNKCHMDQNIQFVLQLTQDRKIKKIDYECEQDSVVVLKGFAKIVQR